MHWVWPSRMACNVAMMLSVGVLLKQQQKHKRRILPCPRMSPRSPDTQPCLTFAY